jgi:hypothetical protein
VHCDQRRDHVITAVFVGSGWKRRSTQAGWLYEH